MRKRIEFEAHKTVKRPTEVAFTTRDGKEADFVASKKTKVSVHMRFTANVK
jgi:hypothetical protein